MQFDHTQLLAMITGASFAAGLNVYATVATLGLLAHFGVLPLPQNLHLLESWWVIGVAAVMFAIEFVADKIPAFDMVWNALHTFVRIPIAALVAYNASAQLSPTAQMLTTLLGAGIAMIAHSGKFAIRAAVTPSPEPISNMALSAGEDVAAIGLTWFATAHPIVAATVTLALIVIVIVLLRMMWRSVKRLLEDTRTTMRGLIHRHSS
ncbi:MAG TPA: DUF4126 domain-containing protein [Candidatus Angelobacter sp.]|nr:DUF4126 domain-containing protein [Candidatus Angelobacter sp.]